MVSIGRAPNTLSLFEPGRTEARDLAFLLSYKGFHVSRFRAQGLEGTEFIALSSFRAVWQGFRVYGLSAAASFYR